MKCKRRKKCQINVLIILHGMNILWELPLYQADGPKDPSTGGGMHRKPGQQDPFYGYNGFPKGCSDDEFPWGKEHELDDPYNAKYFYSTHSELNAILNYRGEAWKEASCM